jgi:hypothetical protein
MYRAVDASNVAARSGWRTPRASRITPEEEHPISKGHSLRKAVENLKIPKDFS